jgi:hypothetical protein
MINLLSLAEFTPKQIALQMLLGVIFKMLK